MRSQRSVPARLILLLVFDVKKEVPALVLAFTHIKGEDHLPSLHEVALQILDYRTDNRHALVTPSHTRTLGSVQFILFPLASNILEVKNASIVEVLSRHKNILKVRWMSISNWVVMCVPCTY